MSDLIKLNKYSIKSDDNGGEALYDVNFTLRKGDICVVRTDSLDNAHFLLRGLATLEYPFEGSYLFKGSKLDFSDYRNLLHVKSKIGYVASDVALISNMTVRENLLLTKKYYESTFTTHIVDKAMRMCQAFEIDDKLDVHPCDLNPLHYQIASAAVAVSTEPELLLLERPEDFIPHSKMVYLNELLDEIRDQGRGAVILSYDREFIRMNANRIITIAEGRIIEGSLPSTRV